MGTHPKMMRTLVKCSMFLFHEPSGINLPVIVSNFKDKCANKILGWIIRIFLILWWTQTFRTSEINK